MHRHWTFLSDVNGKCFGLKFHQHGGQQKAILKGKKWLEEQRRSL